MPGVRFEVVPPRPSALRRHAKHVISVVVAIVFLAIVLPAAVYQFPQVAGADHAYAVLSGSMVPTYNVGDIVVVTEVDPATLRAGDPITFQASAGSDTLFTHRIVAVVATPEGRAFITKGDANEENDPGTVRPELVVGKVMWSIPAYGYLVAFTKSPAGALLVFVLPAVLMILYETVRVTMWIARSAQTKAGPG